MKTPCPVHLSDTISGNAQTWHHLYLQSYDVRTYLLIIKNFLLRLPLTGFQTTTQSDLSLIGTEELSMLPSSLFLSYSISLSILLFFFTTTES